MFNIFIYLLVVFVSYNNPVYLFVGVMDRIVSVESKRFHKTFEMQ